MALFKASDSLPGRFLSTLVGILHDGPVPAIESRGVPAHRMQRLTCFTGRGLNETPPPQEAEHMPQLDHAPNSPS